MKILNIFIALLLTVSIFSCTTTKKNESKELNIYSHRHYDIDKLVIQKFEESTQIKVNLVKSSADELINKLELEGDKSPADLLITVDATKLNLAKQKGLLQPMNIEDNPVFPKLRDPNNYWTAITFRARVIAYDKTKVDPSQLSTYDNLANEKWLNKILVRSSTSEYNQALLASIIYNLGEEEATEWASGIVKNMAQEPKGGDRDQVKAIATGVGQLAIVNTYYVGLMLNSTNEEELKAVSNIGVFFPNQENTGTHINISGIGITKNAPNKENAELFISFLVSDEIQKLYTSNNYEYPASSRVKADSTIATWGEFIFDNLAFADSTYYAKKATEIFDKVGWK